VGDAAAGAAADWLAAIATQPVTELAKLFA
jgi:hypothetical protein